MASPLPGSPTFPLTPPTPTPRSVVRHDLRNVAIVAHVDHGKTTLVDAMLRQTGAFRANQAVVDRVMDSGDLEREKGITILAKQTTDRLRRRPAQHRRHAGSRGLRRRGGALAAHGRFRPAPRRRRRGAAAADPLRPPEGDGAPPAGGRGAQQDRPRRRPPAEVLDDVYELFMDLGADEHQIEFPVVYTNAKAGTATTATSPSRARTCGRCSTSSSTSRRRRPTRPATRCSCSSRTCRPTSTSAGWRSGASGTAAIRVGQRIAVVREEADRHRRRVEPGRTVTLTGTVTSLQTAHGIERVDIAEAGPGDIVSVAGLPEVTIGDTLTDPADPRPLPRLDVDAPTLRMTFGVNTSPLAGREGKYVTSRQIKARLEKEVLGNVSIEVRPDRNRRGLRGPRSRRAPARRAHRADAPRGLRADGLARRCCCAGRRRGPGAVRAGHDRHPARLHRRDPGRRWPAGAASSR